MGYKKHYMMERLGRYAEERPVFDKAILECFLTDLPRWAYFTGDVERRRAVLMAEVETILAGTLSWRKKIVAIWARLNERTKGYFRLREYKVYLDRPKHLCVFRRLFYAYNTKMKKRPLTAVETVLGQVDRVIREDNPEHVNWIVPQAATQGATWRMLDPTVPPPPPSPTPAPRLRVPNLRPIFR